MKKHQNKATGFTLIELLVVIAIIAMLIVILMPAMARVRTQAKNVVCLGQVNQWGLILMLYVQDNEGKFLDLINFTDNDALTKLYGTKDMRYCPSATKTLDEGDSTLPYCP